MRKFELEAIVPIEPGNGINYRAASEKAGMTMQTWFASQWKTVRRDVWESPSIGLIASCVLSGLLALVAFLTATYAPEAVVRAQEAETSTRAAGDGTIPPSWGHATVILTALIVLLVGFEPMLRRAAFTWWQRSGVNGWLALEPWERAVLRAPAMILYALAKTSSALWSAADFLLARPWACLAGTCWHGWRKRYAHLFALIGVLVLITQLSTPTAALVAAICGIVTLLSIVRRWTWIERDRDTFLVERGERQEGRGTIRIGFREDLRDEALVAVCLLCVLAPLSLDALFKLTTAGGDPAFAFPAAASTDDDRWARFQIWLGYFGVELAKTVPFVDWSEVFHVANGSPLTPRTALGSQVAFLLRAGLDLSLLAAALQAMQIATRLSEQEVAFRNNRLPILEPFSEKLEMIKAFRELATDVHLRASSQTSVLKFPAYDVERLKEVAQGDSEIKDVRVRQFATALLQRECEVNPSAAASILTFWTDCARAQPLGEYRSWIENLAGGSQPSALELIFDHAFRLRLLQLAAQEGIDGRVRSHCIRVLGRTELNALERQALVNLIKNNPNLKLRAAAAVSLAKSGAREALPAMRATAAVVADSDVGPAQSIAYALSHFLADSAEIERLFPLSMQQLTRDATQISRGPTAHNAMHPSEDCRLTNRLTLLTPGIAPFPDTFEIGSHAGDPLAFPTELPATTVVVDHPFSIGCFPVSEYEYRMFIRAQTGQASSPAHPRRPQNQVSWWAANAYCSWLSELTGEHYRLPSETEWEYACRAGTQTNYWWGDDWDEKRGRSVETSPRSRADVDAFEPNSWGLWSMHGNVYEWCADPWHETLLDHPRNCDVWLRGGNFSLRALRGGSWNDYPRLHRSGFRHWYETHRQSDSIGFRIAKTIYGVDNTERSP